MHNCSFRDSLALLFYQIRTVPFLWSKFSYMSIVVFGIYFSTSVNPCSCYSSEEVHANNIVTDCEREVGGRPSPAIFLLSRSSSPNRCLAYLHIFIHLSLTSVALFVFLTAFTFSVMLFLLISEAIIKITFKERVCLNFVLNNVYIDYNYAEMLTSCPLCLWAQVEVLPFYTGIKHAWVVYSVI